MLLAVAAMEVHGQELLNSASQQEPATSSEQLDAVNQELMAHLDDQVLEDLKSWNQDLLSQVDLKVCAVEGSLPCTKLCNSSFVSRCL